MTTPQLARRFAAMTGLPVDQQEELAALLCEVDTELTNLDGPDNPVAVRVRAWRKRIDAGEVVVKGRNG